MKKSGDKASNFKHGCTLSGKKTTEYRIWSGMKYRCINLKNPSYPKYGGRGIKVCDRWLKSFEDFIKDMGMRPSLQHSLDRINNNGNYEPSNCRWATLQEQANNKRDTLFYTNKEGVKKCLADWCKESVVSYSVVKTRIIDCGWIIDDAISIPVMTKKEIWARRKLNI